MVSHTRLPLLCSVGEYLQELPRHFSSDTAVAQNSAFLRALAADEAPERLIHEILADREALSRIASRSYRHANGFDKILLFDSRQAGAYRLSIHHWYSAHGESPSKDEPIHNHRFSFWSHIFRGTMSASVYTECDCAEEGSAFLPRYRYLPTSTGNVHTCKYDREACVKRVASTTYSTGDVYYLNYKILHRVHAPGYGQRLCTFVLRGPREQEYAETYNLSYPRDVVAYSTPVMHADELGAVLTRILG